MAAGWTAFLGGPIDRHGLIGRARWATPLRVLLGLALGMMSLGWLSKANCLRANADGTDINWSANRPYVSGCYADSIPLYGIEGLKAGHFPYIYHWESATEGTRYMEYPVLTGLYQWVCARIAEPIYRFSDSIGIGGPKVDYYFAVNATLLAIAWLGTLWFTYKLAGNRVWDVLLVALSPIVGVHIFTNFDSLSTVCAMGALWFWVQRRYAWSGVLIGLGTAFKLWPLYLLGAFLVVSLRTLLYDATPAASSAKGTGVALEPGKEASKRKVVDRPTIPTIPTLPTVPTMKNWAVTLATTVLTWLVVNLPIMLIAPDGWREFFTRNNGRGFEDSTIYSLFSWITGINLARELSVGTQSFISGALFICCCVAIAVFGLRVRREPKVWELTLLIVVAFLMTNKVWSPQYSLWLVPLVALSLPKWRLVFAWMWVEAVYWFIRMWWFLGVTNHGAPEWLLDCFVIARDALLIAIVVKVVQQMRGERPEAPRTEEEALAAKAGAVSAVRSVPAVN